MIDSSDNHASMNMWPYRSATEYLDDLEHASRPDEDLSPRGAERIVSALPLTHGCSHTFTENISATGVFFETDEHQTPGSVVNFTVEVLIKGEKFNLVCEGEVVRVEPRGGKIGIAAKLSRSFLEVA